MATVHNGTTSNGVSNQHGEAGFAVWHHCIHTHSDNIVVVSSDTDTWVYGLAIYAARHLSGKNVYVQRGNSESYININRAATLISNHRVLSTTDYPVLTLVALYVLTGCDYVSSLYRCAKTKFLETLLDNIAFVFAEGPLLKMERGEFQHINEKSWIRLVTAVYYHEYKTFFRNKPITHTYSMICDHPASPEAQRMLSAISYSPDNLTTVFKWHNFIWKVGYHIPKVTKQHEMKLIPSVY